MCFGERGVRLSIPVNGRERELLKCVEVCEPRIHTTYTIVWTIDTEGWLIKRSTTSDRKANKENHENLDNITFRNSSNRLKGMLKIATLKGRVESNFTFHLFIVREPSRPEVKTTTPVRPWTSPMVLICKLLGACLVSHCALRRKWPIIVRLFETPEFTQNPVTQ